MTDKAHRRVEYALILVGIALVGALAAWGASRIEGNLSVTGDLVVSEDASIGLDLTVNDNLTVVEAAAFSDDVSIAGETTFADSLYSAEDMTFAADQTLRVSYLGLMALSGSKGDTTGLQANALFVRNDSLFMLVKDKSSVVTVYP